MKRQDIATQLEFQDWGGSAVVTQATTESSKEAKLDSINQVDVAKLI